MFGVGTRDIGNLGLGVRGYELRVAEGDWKWEFGIGRRDKGLGCGERQEMLVDWLGEQ